MADKILLGDGVSRLLLGDGVSFLTLGAVPNIGAINRNVGPGLPMQSMLLASAPSAGSSNLTLALTGQGATATPGALSPGLSAALTGQGATVTPGTATPGLSAALTGSGATASPGSMAPALALPLVGSGATATPGTLSAGAVIPQSLGMPLRQQFFGPAFDFQPNPLSAVNAPAGGTLGLTGQGATASPGSVGVSLTIALTGQAATAAAGNLAPALARALTGQAATASPGALAPALTLPLVGQGATAAPGTVSAGGNITIALTGQGATAAPGSLAAALSLPLLGQSGAAAAGNLTANVNGNLTVGLTGSSATAAAGSLSPGVSKALVGQGATAAAGSLSAAQAITLALTGQGATASPGALSLAIAKALAGSSVTAAPGSVTAVASGPDLTIALVGTQMTISQGVLTYVPDICKPVPPLQAVYIKLRAFLLTIVCDNAEVIQGLGNRAPMPAGPFVAMTAILQKRLNTNQDRYTDPYPSTTPGSVTVQQNMRFDVQLDCYGPKAGDWAAVIATLLRDDYGCAALAPDCQPLYVDDPRQVAFVSGEEQYVQRWTLTAVLAYNPTTTLPQQFAGAAAVNIVLANQGPTP